MPPIVVRAKASKDVVPAKAPKDVVPAKAPKDVVPAKAGTPFKNLENENGAPAFAGATSSGVTWP
jgi:hypothetical protein